MRHVPFKHFVVQSVAIATIGMITSQAGAAVLYDNLNTVTGAAKAAVLVRPHIPPNSGDTAGVGEGDDYSTGFTSLKVTGLSFFGSVGGSTNFTASFYDSSKALIASVTPTTGELTNVSGIQTLGAADFGPSGITLPGNGYVVFSVTSSDGVNRPSFNLQYQNSAPVVGSNNAASAVRIDYQGNFTTGAFFNGIDPATSTNVPTDVAQFQLTGTGVPEPASIGLVGSVALLVLKRRRGQSLS